MTDYLESSITNEATPVVMLIEKQEFNNETISVSESSQLFIEKASEENFQTSSLVFITAIELK